MKKLVPVFLTASMIINSVSPIFAGDFVDTYDSWARMEISQWSDYGVVNGHNGQFRPNDSITRAEMATIVDNIMQYEVEVKWRRLVCCNMSLCGFRKE